jgi:hypothetical protein
MCAWLRANTAVEAALSAHRQVENWQTGTSSFVAVIVSGPKSSASTGLGCFCFFAYFATMTNRRDGQFQPFFSVPFDILRNRQPV